MENKTLRSYYGDKCAVERTENPLLTAPILSVTKARSESKEEGEMSLVRIGYVNSDIKMN